MSNQVYGIICLVIDVFLILDIFKKSWDMGKKIIWSLVVFFFPIIGWAIYWFIGRK